MIRTFILSSFLKNLMSSLFALLSCGGAATAIFRVLFSVERISVLWALGMMRTAIELFLMRGTRFMNDIILI